MVRAVFDEAWLAARGFNPDGSRNPVARGGVEAGGYALEETGAERPAEPKRGSARTAGSGPLAAGGNGGRPARSRQAGGSPAQRDPMLVMGEPPAVEEQNATGSYRRAGVALRTPETAGESGPQRPTKRLSSRAIAKLLPEQRLQIEVVQHYRPLLQPDARLLGINGELPGGKSMIHRAAVRREMGYQRGTPDLVAMKHSCTLWLECKIPGNDCSDEQSQFSAWAIRTGHGYCVITSIEDAGAALRIWGMICAQ